ncbi:MAG: response regulator [Euryarchaeota archaeon]|nr:response regulator [Euryarchaeota archaeon]MDE1880667.1 response regulator [Euryarchaeota archaeon]MDE2044831.1 response regulator [Thermoplasmata archaeon]
MRADRGRVPSTRPAKSVAGAPPAGVLEKRKYRILVVDDDPDILMLLRRTLSKAKEFESDVVVAPDPKVAMEMLQKQPIDVVLSDQIMPEENGIAFLMDVKERYPETVRMLITAHTNVGAVLRAVNLAQVHGYIEKPFDPQEVNRRLEEALLRRQERVRMVLINVSRVEEALQVVKEFEEKMTKAPKEVVKVGLTLAFESPVDFNRFTFEVFQSKRSRIGDVHVFEGKFHVTVTLRPPEGHLSAS